MMSCAESDDGFGNGVSDSTPDDVSETVTVSLYKNSGQTIDGIFVDVNDRLTSSDGWGFVDVGKVKTLGDVNEIPYEGWTGSVPAKLGRGYVAYNHRIGEFYRLMVSNVAHDEMGTITGFQIKYQNPFVGLDRQILLDQEEIMVDADGGYVTVHITNPSVLPCDINCSSSWVRVVSRGENEFGVPSDSVVFLIDRMVDPVDSYAEVTFRTADDQLTILPIFQRGSEEWQSTTTIADLKLKYVSKERNCFELIVEPTVITGYVISSDREGNVYKTIVVDDGTGAIPISVNSYSLYNSYPQGVRLAIDLTGFYIGNYRGYQMVGSVNESSFNPSISFIEEQEFRNHVQRLSDEERMSEPYRVSIQELKTVLDDSPTAVLWQGRYVEIPDVSFCESGLPLAEYQTTTTRYVVEESQCKLAVRTSGYSTFASELTPAGVGSIRGILSYYDDEWQLIMNAISDLGYFDPSAVLPGQPEPSLPFGDGTFDNPYRVSSVISLGNPGDQAWVDGYVVGYVPGMLIEESVFGADDAVSAHILIADSPDEIDYRKCVPVQLLAGSMARLNLNLRDNPAVLHTQVRVKGSLLKYFGVAGVKMVSEFGK